MSYPWPEEWLEEHKKDYDVPEDGLDACPWMEELKSHVKRQLSEADFSRFDLILVMDNANVRAVKAMASAPEQRDKVRMLGSYMTSHADVSEIPDPYYGDDSDFDYALDLIEDACRGLLAEM